TILFYVTSLYVTHLITAIATYLLPSLCLPMFLHLFFFYSCADPRNLHFSLHDALPISVTRQEPVLPGREMYRIPRKAQPRMAEDYPLESHLTGFCRVGVRQFLYAAEAHGGQTS